MDFEQAKKLVDETSRSTAVKHPKILILDLCNVVKFLLDEIDRIKMPVVSILPKRLPEDVELKPRLVPMRQQQFPPSPPYPKEGGQRKFRSGNAGDAE